jgi:hypothetical protein
MANPAELDLMIEVTGSPSVLLAVAMNEHSTPKILSNLVSRIRDLEYDTEKPLLLAVAQNRNADVRVLSEILRSPLVDWKERKILEVVELHPNATTKIKQEVFEIRKRRN